MKTKEYYDKESKIYDKKRFSTPMGRWIDKIEKEMVLKNLTGWTALELCSGTGRYANYLTEKGFTYTGIDNSKGMIKKAKEKNKNGDFILKDVKDIKKLKKQYDNIFVARAIKFWDNPQKVINDSYELLTNHGQLILCFQNKDWYLNKILMDREQEKQDKHPYLRTHSVGTEKYYYDIEIETMMLKAGFKNITTKHYFHLIGYVIIKDFIPKILQHPIVWLFKTFDNKLNIGYRTCMVGEKEK